MGHSNLSLSYLVQYIEGHVAARDDSVTMHIARAVGLSHVSTQKCGSHKVDTMHIARACSMQLQAQQLIF